MKKTKLTALLSLLCVMALCLGLFAGCGNSTAAEASEASATSSAATEEAPAAEATEQSAAAEALPAESIFPLEETATFTMFYVWSPHFVELGFDSPNDFQFFAELENRTNVHIDFTTIGANIFEETFLLMMATQDYTDIFFNCAGSYNGGIAKAIDDDAWIDLAPYMETLAPNYMALMESDPEFTKANYTDEGNIGEFMQYYTNSFNNGGNLIRQDWLDKLGLEVPETYDDWYDVLSAFTKEYGLTESILSTVPTSGYWPQVDDGYIVRDGKVVNAFAEEDLAVPYLETVKKWYDAGLYSVDAYAGYTPDDSMTKILNGEVGIYNVDVDQVDTYAEQMADPDYAYTAIGKPVLNAGDTPKDGSQTTYGHGFTISSACEDVELAVQWMDNWYTEDVELLANYGIEGVSFEYDDAGVPHFTSAVLDDPEGLNFALFKYVVDWGPTVLDWDRKRDTYTEFQQNALDIWCDNDDSMTFPPFASYTLDESTELAIYQTDIQTVLDENLPKFATGAMSIDDYDEFVQMLNDCGLQEVLAIKQAAYERYEARGN